MRATFWLINIWKIDLCTLFGKTFTFIFISKKKKKIINWCSNTRRERKKSLKLCEASRYIILLREINPNSLQIRKINPGKCLSRNRLQHQHFLFSITYKINRLIFIYTAQYFSERLGKLQGNIPFLFRFLFYFFFFCYFQFGFFLLQSRENLCWTHLKNEQIKTSEFRRDRTGIVDG